MWIFKDTIASKEKVLIRKNVNVHTSFTRTCREALQVITELSEGRRRLLSFAAAPQPRVFLKIVHAKSTVQPSSYATPKFQGIHHPLRPTFQVSTFLTPHPS